MLSLLLNRLRLQSASSGRLGPRRDRARSPRPGWESLEQRVALSLGGEGVVPTTSGSDQWDAATASAPGGRSVVVWTHRDSPTDTDILAQLYDAAGNKSGGQITINDSGNTRDGSPAVAMDSYGDFVVAWTRTFTASTATSQFTNKDVLAARFDGVGNNRDGINRYLVVANSAKDEHEPSVAITDGDREGLVGSPGDFVVAYTLAYSHIDADVYATRFRAGVASWTVPVAVSGTNESAPSVALNPSGSSIIAIAFQKQAIGSDTDIAMSRYGTGGSFLDTRAVASSPNRELAPSLAIDASNNVVVAYEYERSGSDHDIRARRMSSSGVVGPEIFVDSSGLFGANPVVALQPTTVRFVVAYEAGVGASRSVTVKEFGPGSTPLGTFNAGPSRAGPSLSVDGQGNYQLAYTSLTGMGTDPGLGVRRRRGKL